MKTKNNIAEDKLLDSLKEEYVCTKVARLHYKSQGTISLKKYKTLRARELMILAELDKHSLIKKDFTLLDAEVFEKLNQIKGS